jgi:chromosome segregation ATPase
MHSESKGIDRDKLVSALETIFGELVGDELLTVRKATDELSSNLSERLESVTQFATQALEQTKNDLASRVDEIGPKLDEIDQAHKKSVAELGELDPRLAELEKAHKESTARIDDLVPKLDELDDDHKKSMCEISERADRSLGEMKQELAGQLQSFKGQLEGNVSTEAAKTRDALEVLEKKMSDLESALEQHRANTERLSGLLKSMASVFSVDAKSAEAAPVSPEPKKSEARDPQQEVPQKVEAPQLPTDDAVENVLARVFPDDS